MPTDIHTPFTKAGINIDIGNRCTLQCSQCARTKFIRQGVPLPGKDMNMEQFTKVANFFENRTIHFCGTFSDPIYNPSFIDMLALCKAKHINARISTAASHKPASWYSKAFAANTDAEWIFGIDGLPGQSHIYRINQDGVKLFNIMIAGRDAGLSVTWQYIVFDYNKKRVTKAKRIAKKYKIKFYLIETTRK